MRGFFPIKYFFQIYVGHLCIFIVSVILFWFYGKFQQKWNVIKFVTQHQHEVSLEMMQQNEDILKVDIIYFQKYCIEL